MEEQKNFLTVPIAIVAAGIIIGGAIFLSRGGEGKDIFRDNKAPSGAPSETSEITLRPVDASEHILGNPDADIVMVEYSDLECPFCKTFHSTMQVILDEYGKDGKVAWVYRHFPIDERHPKARKESEATECAGELGGNEKFWSFVQRIFAVTPSNNGLDLALLPKIAAEVGLDKTKFQSCLESGKYAEKIQADYGDGVSAGANGTPHTVLILKKEATAASLKRLQEINQTILRQLPPGNPNVITLDSGKRKIGISGALPLSLMKEMIELILSGK